ncbi:hypothetical protein A1O3_04840 [Capronia epimyces CBS 606.96]|uniref:Xylanolytic transcriptional activator regulatory domain-containing protein n=1 Tax=Capronia epimyces CBS 606.96 TaxID=1182542 RepID=W9XVB1_9EURO|nr:uncharacterized protein A1O3_04840 [Capronia epimyces CBS 606.96]EXJ84173.1 hypothetical protein A1O3_04840 [Capronia epimyces CBS 606.96]
MNIACGSRGPMKGVFSKSRYFGQSHWMNCCISPSIQVIFELCYQQDADSISEIHHLHQKCKTAGRAIKADEKILPQVAPDLSDYIPGREVADKLVHSYLETFECIYPVLHVPSFLSEYEGYWLDPKIASNTLVTKLLLVMAIGTIFQPQAEVATLRPSALQWIYVAQTWLSTPFDKQCLTVEGMQIQCLLLLARLAYDVDGDMLWLSAGYLVRAAMHIGLHIDAESYTFQKPCPQDIQHRRKLWATVLEIVVQTSMDSGGLPMISANDYDCKPPLNADDMEQKDLDGFLSTVKPHDQFTQSSLQIMLVRSLPLRLEIAAFVNNFRPESGTYDKAIQLSEKLLKECSANSALLQTFKKSSSGPTDFQVNLVELMTHQFLLALHWPYALKAKSYRTFYYSRKVCLDSALLLSSNSSQTQGDAYTHLRIWGGGLFRAVPLTTTSLIAEELFDQIETDAASFSKNATLLDRRNGLCKYIQDYVQFALVRIRHGQPDVKGHMVFSAVLAKAEALLSGNPVEESILAALQKSLTICYEVLREQIGGLSPQLRPPKSGTQLQLGIGDTVDAPLTGNIMTSDGWLGLDDFENMDWWLPSSIMDPMAESL